MTLIPMGKRVLVEMARPTEVVHKGIILQAPEQKRCELVTVLAIGSEVVGLNVGDVVLVDRYIGMEAQIDDRKLIVIKFEDILAVYQNGTSP